MILLHDIIEIFGLADHDRGAVFLVVALDGRFVGGTPIDRNLLRYAALATDRLREEALGRFLVALLCEEKVNGLPVLIDCTVQIFPLTFYLNIGLVEAPTRPHRA